MKAYRKFPLYLFASECGVDYALKLPIKSFPQSQMTGVLEYRGGGRGRKIGRLHADSLIMFSV